MNLTSADLLDRAAHDILHAYSMSAVQPLAMGTGGGFSGARLWRLPHVNGDLCLRASPVGQENAERLHRIHHLLCLARERGLPFVPMVLAATSGATWIEHLGRYWEVMTWMPGVADFHTRPTRARLQAACAALALLHAVWAKEPVAPGRCPALFRRLEAARAWISLLDSGWVPDWSRSDDDPIQPWATRAWRQIVRRIREVPKCLETWMERRVPLQPCLCDVWHDHVLFTGDVVTGLIDFGSVKIDHVAVDLARLLGSLVGDDAAMRSAGLDAYRMLRPLTLEEEALIQVLDETGVIVGLANWLTWLYREERHYDDRAAVARRLAELVERVERWP